MPFPRVVVHETDEVDAVLGMVEKLPADQLADLPGAHNEGVLQVAELPPQYARATDLPRDTRRMAATQKTMMRPIDGSNRPEIREPRRTIHDPTVTRFRTPIRSSTVE